MICSNISPIAIRNIATRAFALHRKAGLGHSWMAENVRFRNNEYSFCRREHLNPSLESPFAAFSRLKEAVPLSTDCLGALVLLLHIRRFFLIVALQ
jgi:hypothetical protein